MKKYTFFLNFEGTGDNPQEAYENAMENLIQSFGEYAEAPGIIYEADEPIPAADLLSGSPFQEFGICHGEDEI